MKLRFFKSDDHGEAFILDDDTGIAARILNHTLAKAERGPGYYENMWPLLITRTVEYVYEVTGLSREDFTEVDSYGKPLQDAA